MEGNALPGVCGAPSQVRAVEDLLRHVPKKMLGVQPRHPPAVAAAGHECGDVREGIHEELIAQVGGVAADELLLDACHDLLVVLRLEVALPLLEHPSKGQVVVRGQNRPARDRRQGGHVPEEIELPQAPEDAEVKKRSTEATAGQCQAEACGLRRNHTDPPLVGLPLECRKGGFRPSPSLPCYPP